MKKIILIFLTLFCVTGCYDYQELNDRAIVSGISIDFEKDEFIVNYEILNNQKSEDPYIKAYMVEGMGKTIVEAFQDASDKISKETYLSHLKVLVIGESAAKEQLRNIADFMLREPNIRNMFIPVIAHENTAKEILQNTTKETPVVSEKIASMIRNNKYTENVSLKIDFDHFMDQYEDERIDPSMSAVRIIDDKVSLDGIAILEEGQLKKILSDHYAAIFNVLNNDSTNHQLSLPCESEKEGYTIINLYNNKKTKIEVSEETLKVNSNLTASVVKDSCGYDFREGEIYEELSNKFANLLKEEYQLFWDEIKKENTDVLGIRKKYYQKTRKNLDNWNDLKLESEIIIKINKNGKTFEVKKDE